ncbi:hypothetical protein ACJX0J_023103, partial [Zea mays]
MELKFVWAFYNSIHGNQKNVFFTVAMQTLHFVGVVFLEFCCIHFYIVGMFFSHFIEKGLHHLTLTRTCSPEKESEDRGGRRGGEGEKRKGGDGEGEKGKEGHEARGKEGEEARGKEGEEGQEGRGKKGDGGQERRGKEGEEEERGDSLYAASSVLSTALNGTGAIVADQLAKGINLLVVKHNSEGNLLSCLSAVLQMYYLIILLGLYNIYVKFFYTCFLFFLFLAFVSLLHVPFWFVWSDMEMENIIHRLKNEESKKKPVYVGELVYLSSFLIYLKAAKVTLTEYEFNQKNVPNLQSQLENIVGENYFLNQSAKEAYRSYVLAYDSHSMKDIFNVHQLDLQ